MGGMSILRLFVATVFGIVGGLAAGIVFVVACSATVGTDSDAGSPEWVKSLGGLCWLPPLFGGFLGAVAAVLIVRRSGNGDGQRRPPSPLDAV